MDKREKYEFAQQLLVEEIVSTLHRATDDETTSYHIIFGEICKLIISTVTGGSAGVSINADQEARIALVLFRQVVVGSISNYVVKRNIIETRYLLCKVLDKCLPSVTSRAISAYHRKEEMELG